MPAPAPTLLGKQVLIDLSFCNADGTPVRQVQLSGTIVRVAADGIDVQLADAAATVPFTLPPDVTAFEQATPGEERVASTGAVVRTPDLLTRWTITAPPEDPRRFARPDWRAHVPGL